MDRKAFAKGMFILTTAYKEEFSRDQMNVYYSFLNHLTPAQLEKAARRHIAKSSWFPKINELLQAAQEFRPTPMGAWNKLAEAAETGKKPELDYATEQALTAIGGWEAFCYSSYQDLKYWVNDFKHAYLTAQAREEEVVNMPNTKPVPQLEGR